MNYKCGHYDSQRKRVGRDDGEEEGTETYYACRRQGGRGARTGTSDMTCKIFYYGVDVRINGVGVIMKEDYIGGVLEANIVSDRIMYMKLDIEDVLMTATSEVLDRREGQVLYRSG